MLEKERVKQLQAAQQLKISPSAASTETAVATVFTGNSVSKRRLADAYSPHDFTDLIGSDKTNRFALKWLKSWDFKVFNKVNY